MCGALGLCKTQQAALAEVQAQEQIMSNEIPQVDLSQQVAPFLLNVPELLYPQESPKQEAPTQETPKQVYCLYNTWTAVRFPHFWRVLSSSVSDSSCRKVMTCARNVSISWLLFKRKLRPTPHLLTLSLPIMRTSVMSWDQACLKWWEPHKSGEVLI